MFSLHIYIYVYVYVYVNVFVGYRYHHFDSQCCESSRGRPDRRDRQGRR